MSDASWRDRLRTLPVFSGQLPTFDTDAAPADPTVLFTEWLGFALESGVSQPHAVTLATVSGEGATSARTLLLKDVTSAGLWFATLSSSPKGRDLAGNPRAALLLYWREQGRQIRVVGDVEPGSRELARIDFLKRHPNARAIAAGGQQSEPLPATDAEYVSAVSAARERIDADPDYVPDEWQAYLVRAVEFEFWQAARERDQLRLRYRRDGDGWARELLWP
ncbi:MAG: pyridoxal 5'-phosphate synthase [Actinomycetota bacterium]